MRAVDAELERASRGETSPVNAPSSSQWTFCAKTRDAGSRERARPPRRATMNGGQTTTSTPSSPRGRLASAAQNAARLGRRLEHLPVAGDQEAIEAAHPSGLRIAATPGSSLPSRSSSEAPPPVETQSIRSASAELLDRAHRVAAADDRVRVRTRRPPAATAIVPSANARPLEDAHRAVPEDRLAPRDLLGEVLARLRADVERRASLRHLVAGDDRASRRPPRTRPRATTSVGSRSRRHRAERSHAPRPSCRRRGLRRPARPSEREDADLVLDLRAAEDGHERPLGLARAARRAPRARVEQQARVGRAAGARRPRSRRARGARSRRRRSRRGRRARRARARTRDRSSSRPGRSACSRAGARGRRAGARASRAATGSIENARVLALRPPEVRAEDELRRVALEQELERRQRRADPRVVGDAAVLERHVEVDADEDALARDVGVPNRARHDRTTSRRCTRSTSRHE